MKLAIVGSYGHVGTVLAGLEEAKGVELVAAAPWGPDDPLRFAREGPRAGLAVHDDYRAMLDAVAPDVAAVFTPFAQLATAASAAAERGCHVFMEKPLATTQADQDRLREAVYTAGVQLAACLTMRGEAAYRTIRRAVADGRIGKVACAAAQKSYPFGERDEFYATRQSYGGTICWIGIHALDLIAWCTGRDYRRVAAVAGNLAHPSRPGMEDAGGILAELTGGAAAVIRFDYLRPRGKADRRWGDDRLRIAGDEGIVETTDCGAGVELTTPDAVETLAPEPAANVFAEFVAGVTGRKPPLISTEESFRITEVALKARDAQDTGRFVEL